MSWFLKGLKKGIKTEKFPKEEPKEVSLWSSRIKRIKEGSVVPPTNSIEGDYWKPERCIFCGRCYPAFAPTNEIDIFI